MESLLNRYRAGSGRFAYWSITGADISMIAEHIVADFQIAPTGTHHVWGVFSDDVEKRGTYALSLHVHLSDQDVLQVPELYLTSMPRAEDGVDILLGRDLLLLMRFLYDGVKGTFSLTR